MRWRSVAVLFCTAIFVYPNKAEKDELFQFLLQALYSTYIIKGSHPINTRGRYFNDVVTRNVCPGSVGIARHPKPRFSHEKLICDHRCIFFLFVKKRKMGRKILKKLSQKFRSLPPRITRIFFLQLHVAYHSYSFNHLSAYIIDTAVFGKTISVGGR